MIQLLLIHFMKKMCSFLNPHIYHLSKSRTNTRNVMSIFWGWTLQLSERILQHVQHIQYDLGGPFPDGWQNGDRSTQVCHWWHRKNGLATVVSLDTVALSTIMSSAAGARRSIKRQMTWGLLSALDRIMAWNFNLKEKSFGNIFTIWSFKCLHSVLPT